MSDAQLQEIRRRLTENFDTREKWEEHHELVMTHCDEYMVLLRERQDHHLGVRLAKLNEVEVRHALVRLGFGLPEEKHDNYLEWIEYLEATNMALKLVDKHIDCGLLLRAEIVDLHQVLSDLWATLESGLDQGNEFQVEVSTIFARMDYHCNRREFLEDKFTLERMAVSILFEEEPEWV